MSMTEKELQTYHSTVNIWPSFHNRQYCKHVLTFDRTVNICFQFVFGHTYTRRNVYSPDFQSNSNSNVYSPQHFRSSYKDIFGHLYSVKLTNLSQMIKFLNDMDKMAIKTSENQTLISVLDTFSKPDKKCPFSAIWILSEHWVV